VNSDWRPKEPGDIHPTCGAPLVLKDGMFALRDIGYFPGLVCETCNALWDYPANSFLAAARERDRKAKESAREE